MIRPTDIDRRTFLSSAGKGLGLMALSSATVASLFETVNAAGKAVSHLSPIEVAADEDYWATIQQAFSLLPFLLDGSLLVHLPQAPEQADEEATE